MRQIFWDVRWNNKGIKNGLPSYLVLDKEGRRMERKIRKDTRVLWVLKALLAAYVITGILLLLLAMALYRLELNEKSVSAAVIAIYVLSTLVGGIVIGKLARVRRFAWGLGLGCAYFILLLLITLGVYHTLSGDGVHLVTTFILCAGGGMAGAMIS